MTFPRSRLFAASFACTLWAAAIVVLGAHGVSGKEARYLQSLDGPAPIPLMYLGAKHMVTALARSSACVMSIGRQWSALNVTGTHEDARLRWHAQAAHGVSGPRRGRIIPPRLCRRASG